MLLLTPPPVGCGLMMNGGNYCYLLLFVYENVSLYENISVFYITKNFFYVLTFLVYDPETPYKICSVSGDGSL
jgi:hypothetical protein